MGGRKNSWPVKTCFTYPKRLLSGVVPACGRVTVEYLAG